MIAGIYKNVYELKKEREEDLKPVRELEIKTEQVLKKHLGNYYNSRLIFDNTFEEGKKFKYGALNIGGLGIMKYGEYCVVIKKEKSEKYSTLTFIKEDSLNYVGESGLNIEILCQDIANRECVNYLASQKHENDIKEKPIEGWASMICCDNNYIESITTDDILNEHIKCVRISKNDYSLYFDYLYEDFISKLSEIKKYRLEDFRNMQILLNKKGIKLEIIDDNEN
ncbi:MAG: hypothetical protein K8S18_19100 [Desulfobacula sp.]|nr:hypothetical protein [Desulfobacula sp.]